MNRTPVLGREEYVEQAYFFRVFRERLADQRPAQEVLSHLVDELLSTTRLTLAVGFLLDELKHSGRMSEAMFRLDHYFTPFQSHVLAQAEVDLSRLTMSQALILLEREAEYRSGEPSPAGLFVYELEALARNRLGYREGLDAMRRDGFFDDQWSEYIGFVARQLGSRDFAELVYWRSEYYVEERSRSDPDYQPRFPILFSSKAGRIAAANRGKDPVYLFATLQRQLGYPEVPKPPREIEPEMQMAELAYRIKNLDARLGLLESEIAGKVDFQKFISKPPKGIQPHLETPRGPAASETPWLDLPHDD